MFSPIVRLIHRIKAIRRIELSSDDSGFIFHRNVRIQIEAGGKIIASNGNVTVGFPLADSPFASHLDSHIFVGKNARLVFNGPVAIAPGATIRVSDNATVVFEGETFISQNFVLLCKKRIEIGRNTAISWNVTLIDDDGHSFYSSKGRPIRGFYRPLLIGENVGIQMNVQIPRGVTIGESTVVSAGTVLRRNVPARCLAYQENSLRVREGIFAPPSTKEKNETVQ